MTDIKLENIFRILTLSHEVSTFLPVKIKIKKIGIERTNKARFENWCDYVGSVVKEKMGTLSGTRVIF